MQGTVGARIMYSRLEVGSRFLHAIIYISMIPISDLPTHIPEILAMGGKFRIWDLTAGQLAENQMITHYTNSNI